MSIKIGDTVRIGNDTGIVKDIFTSQTSGESGFVELQMVKNAFGQGRHEIISIEAANNLIVESTNFDMMTEIERRLAVIFGLLYTNLPLSRPEIKQAVEKATKRLYNEH